MNEKKRKISTCVYVHSIFHHWACILIFEGHFVEYVCWWELVCELSETLHYLYSGFMYFESEMSDFLLRALYYCLFHHYIHCWCDFTSCLIWVDHYSSSCYLLCHHPHFAFDSSPLSYPCSSLTTTYSQFDTSCASSLHISLSDHFSSLSLILIMFTLGTLRAMAHEIFCTCCISYMRAWVLIIGYLSLVSLHFYYPITLAYITSCILRPPWGHGIRCRLGQPLLRPRLRLGCFFF